MAGNICLDLPEVAVGDAQDDGAPPRPPPNKASHPTYTDEDAEEDVQVYWCTVAQ